MQRVASEHEERVAEVAAAVKQRAAEGGQASLGKSAVSHFVPNPHDPRHNDRKIDVRALDRVLEIDIERKRCVVEPGVTFAELVRRTLPFGLVPKLVPELQGITVGGAISGCSVESMSYKYGGFHDSCLEYEVVTGQGDVLRCSRESEPLLFDMLHGSYGTLGILTEITFELTSAKPFVAMENQLYPTFAAFEAGMRAAMHDPAVDFVDGIVHGPDAFVLCVGRFTDAPAASPSDYTGTQIYYKSTRSKRTDVLTTFDYFFRYDTECHWLTRTLPGLENRVVRKLLGRWLLGSTNLLTWSKRLRRVLKLQKHPDVVVDVFIPATRFGEFYSWYERTFDFFPLWVVPYRVPKQYAWVDDGHAAKMVGDLYIDCAVYGKKNNTPGIDYSRMLEEKTYELGGVKTLISQNHYDVARFWEIYNRKNYDAVKQRMDPANLFRGLYEKFHFGNGNGNGNGNGKRRA